MTKNYDIYEGVPLGNYNKREIFGPIISSKESYDVRILVILNNILNDLLISDYDNEKTRMYCLHRIQFIESLLGNEDPDIEIDSTFPKNDVYLTRFVEYGFLKDRQIGRLYSKNKSVIYRYPKDLRYFLFQGSTYQDFDLKNCHPTIMYEFAKNNMNEHDSPLLEEFISDRAKFHEKILNEYPSENSIKKTIIIALNSDPKGFKHASKTMTALCEEFSLIRKKIRESMTDVEQLILLNIDPLKDPNIRFQSYYCMTRESELLISLRNHLLYKIEGSSEKHLHFIPVFDGALIHHEKVSKEGVRNLITEFNGSSRFLKFEKKDFELPEDSIITKELFKQYDAMLEITSQLNSIVNDKLLDYLEIKPFRIDDIYMEDFLKRTSVKQKEVQNRVKRALKDSIPLSQVDQKEVCHEDYIIVRRQVRKFEAIFRRKFLANTEGDYLKMKSVVSNLQTSISHSQVIEKVS